MNRTSKVLTGIAVAGVLLSNPVVADKPPWAGAGKGKGRDVQMQPAQRGGYFVDRHRVTVREYYGNEFQRGHCPPGLAKKNNGCMPPGQAKKWQMGRPLPRDVIFYDLPPSLVVSIGTPPAGHRFVRVASDILLIAIGTGLVVDAVEDLGRL